MNADALQLRRTFGLFIKKGRDARNLSQEGAARLADIDRQTWYRIENGVTGTKRDTVVKIAKALDLDEDESLRRAGYLSPNDVVDDGGLFKGLEKLSPERQKLARRQVQAIIESLAEEEHDFDYIDEEEGEGPDNQTAGRKRQPRP